MNRKQLFRFLVVGVVSNLTLLGVSWLAVTLGVPPYVAVTGVYVIGLVSSLLLNGRWTFGTLNRQTAVGKSIKFFILYGLGYLYSIAAYWVIIQWGWGHAITQLLVMGSAAVLLFLGQKFWVFHHVTAGDQSDSIQ